MITEISYPIELITEGFKNAFPSQQPLYFKLNRKDAIISSIVSGVDNNVRIAITGTFGDIEVGQYITWRTDGYTLRTNQVVSIIDTSTIEIDEVFVSSNATNGFLNYHVNHFVEIRYVVDNSVSDDQGAIELFDDYSQVPADRNGDIRANITLPAELLTPDFDLDSRVFSNLYIKYKIQYRESYEGNRNGSWISPSDDIPILLVHASTTLEQNQFTDKNITKRYFRGYPLLYSFVYSSINDSGANTLSIRMNEYAINKELIATSDVLNVTNVDGQILLLVDTDNLDDDTCFVAFEASITSDNSQYDPAHYDPAQYA